MSEALPGIAAHVLLVGIGARGETRFVFDERR